MHTQVLRLTLILSLLFIPAVTLAASCADLGRLTIDTVTITAAESKAEGILEQRFGPDFSLPSHCAVAAVLSPSDDSHIEMALWLPEDWNGKFLAVGNGGWAGSISYSAMARGLQAGYAVASNDTGHQGASAAFAAGHPEKLVDFGWRAMHEMTVLSKTLVEAFYDIAPRLSYYQGCSTGGRQGMMEAQRFPEDFDGMIIGAPVYNMLALNATQFSNMKTLIEDRRQAFTPDEVELLHNAVLQACETNDGVADGFLNNPLACDFEPASLQCGNTDSVSCLTVDQVRAVERVYGGVYSPSGELYYPGHARGFELGWRMPAADDVPSDLQTDATRYVLYEDPEWDWRRFDLDRDLPAVREKAGYLEALDTDLREFQARGGKLLFYHGWNDPGPSPLNTINYYQGVLQTVGGDMDDWMRLYMMPGMGHCSGGIGPDNADFLGALEAWVEEDVAPASITASRIREGRVDMTRPLCPYPAVATWDGSGNPDDAASYSCR
jgi:feruloyl esterase